MFKYPNMDMSHVVYAQHGRVQGLFQPPAEPALPFIAVMPECTARGKIEQIEHHSGRYHFISNGGLIYDEAKRLSREQNGHYMDQFTYTERSTDWRRDDNIAESIWYQMARELFPQPSWMIMSTGTSGTSPTPGRYICYHGHPTRLMVIDPEDSVFHAFFTSAISN